MRYKAVWNDKVLAESNETKSIEGNIYFPADSIRKEFFKEAETHTTCPWKGKAFYYSVEVDGKVNEDAAWYYPKASPLARDIEGYVAFWKGIEIQEG